MGRLTLNVLLSFAQFEREVTGERIRDKIAASKRKGMCRSSCFPAEVKSRFRGQLPVDCVAGLEEIDNVRPLIIIPSWIDGLLQRTCNPAQQAQVKQVWNELASEFLKIDFVRAHRNPLQRDLAEERIVYLYLDAIYPKVRSGGRVVALPVLVALGVRETGEKVLLALMTGGAESSGIWKLSKCGARPVRGVPRGA